MSCLANIEFSTNDLNLFFAKKIIFCGFTSECKLFTREILFQYPTRGLSEPCESVEFPESTYKFGNLQLKRMDSELSKVINKFETIIVNGTISKEFITNYAGSNVKVIDIHQKQPVSSHTE